VEGIASRRFKAFSVQYHPEAGPGPHDARYLFEGFRALMAGEIDNAREAAGAPSGNTGTAPSGTTTAAAGSAA
jgi:hypothetical protein